MAIAERLGVYKRPQGTFDAEMEFKDAGLVAASAAATVDSTAKVVDVGGALFKGCIYIDVSAMEVASGDELYTIHVQGSTDGNFTNDATSCSLCSIQIGAATPLLLGAVDTVGRYKLYFDNEHDGTYFRYLRVYTVVAGSIDTGINFTAYAGEM